EWDREHGAALPLEAVQFLLSVCPDLGRAATLDNDHDLFVHVALGVERSRAWDLDHITAPAPFGAVKLDEGSVPSHALPAFERHVLYAAHADPAIDRNPLRLHVIVIRRIRPLPGAIARVLEAFRLVPV